ncbi:AMP-binding protein [Paraburkholderia aspalathi]|uniref:Acyl-CoA synthetase (AMP-forming)/AMP-acid ligase II n=1 Tax=Paraburkholderia aspalathi TaxID=1324617 RepID=A0A1I7ERU5_9BURK|nr:AMP-binding protein [Paraburkholderia aspalathi]SFU26649.1 Acyl-CoA synthetase (AMP-forming)/AMP-acid ligase II [Paraburkholderia aspalathi]
MYKSLTINDFLNRALVAYPDRVAIVDEEVQPAKSWGEMTYAELGRKARAQAATLDEMGVPVGARVAIVSQNSARLICTFYGVSGWGRVLVPVNFRLAPAEIRHIMAHSGAEVLLLDPEFRHLAELVPCQRTFVLGDDDDKIWGSAADPVPWVEDEMATAVINYTSGTTGRPKGVQMSHRHLWLNAVVFGWQTSVSDRDVYLHAVQAFHGNGWGQVYAATAMGVKHVVMRKMDGTELLRRIQSHGVTYLGAAPAVVTAILDGAKTWDGPIPGHGRLRIICGGAPPPTRTIQRVRDELGWELIQVYGLTETSTLLTFNRMRAEWDDLDSFEQARLLGRAGVPTLNVQLRIDSNGELLARSSRILDSYWNDPEATARAHDGDWFRTGDGGFISDGYLTITDRIKDIIVSGGENVDSVEVENAMTSHPAVRDVAVIGIPDEKWGELVTALVVLEAGQNVTDADLIAHCRQHVAGYKCPKRVEFRNELPRTASGKLQKYLLRKPYWENLTRQVN